MPDMHFAFMTLENLPTKAISKSNFRSDTQEIPSGLTEKERKYYERFSHRTAVMVGDEMDCVV